MAPLDPDLRSALERAIIAARDDAEKAAEVTLKSLAIDQPDAFSTQTAEQRRLRKALRARARQLGGGNQQGGFRPLVEEVAYEQWHRMLFARFLADNGLLMHPSGVPVSLEDCAELAAEEGEADAWTLAARYASRMLPGIFRTDDPSAQVPLAREGRVALETILAALPPAVFTADDALGWVYQFWQTKKKKEVNQSGRKIGGAELFPVTQLFTEHYMVQFLLENSLGAWWAARNPDSPLVKDFSYLRFADDGTPAAGTFPSWPEHAADVAVMDPCCGSGHFLVAAFEMLRRMRMEEERLGETEAAEAVLRDNLFGLEIDPRCVQIAAFSIALAAWKVGGYRPLPSLNLACSGIPVSGQLEEWTKLAGDANLKFTLERLYYLFRNAPDLGSLINPADVPLRDRMFAPDFAKVAPVLERALAKERAEDPVAAVFGEAAVGVARAADLLARQYTLVATNVPYLARGRQSEVIKEHLERQYSAAKADLATVFVERCRAFVTPGGVYALVTPQNWLFLGSYRHLREALLKEQAWQMVARLGTGAFETITGEVVNVTLGVLVNARPATEHQIVGLDTSVPRTTREKSNLLREAPLQFREQAQLLRNPDARVALDWTPEEGIPLLSSYAKCLVGIQTGDNPFYMRHWWEVPPRTRTWALSVSGSMSHDPNSGREWALRWEGGIGKLSTDPQARVQGLEALGRMGVLLGRVGGISAYRYWGELFDQNAAVILPKNSAHLPAIWSFCSSPEFHVAVRRIDAKMNVTNATLVKVPFDLARWHKVAEEQYPNGLPMSYSKDPTQWLFKGDPSESTEPLQVAVARLLGYCWPQQERDRLARLADEDGIVPLSPVAGEEPAAERLRAVLASAFGEGWSPELQERLLQQVGFAGKGLDLWLRDGFFEQHTKLFQQRPFIWHIWDGRKDGFSALVNYHKLDAARLDKLIYTYLGDWIRNQRIARDAGTAGADARLVAALDLQKKLEAIRDGEPPYDIYVRWKPIEKQPIGWNPDIDDGVRLNIRPFVTAGVLRARVNVNWNKDRGTNPDGTERINDRHLTIAEKQAARRAAGLA